MTIEFRRLVEADLPMLHDWLNEPGVVAWWEGDDVSWDAVVRDYAPDAEGSSEHWIGCVDGVAVGWIQCYLAADEPDETERWFALGVDRSAAGIDYLIGNPSVRGKGLGSSMIRTFATEVVLGLHPEWTQVCAGPFAANEASCRALAKAGFRFLGVIEDEDGPCHLMVLDRRRRLRLMALCARSWPLGPPRAEAIVPVRRGGVTSDPLRNRGLRVTR